MPKVKEVKDKIDVSPDQPVVPTGDREARWASYVAHYKKVNPVKGAAKEANGEFKVIPVSFK